MKNKKLELNEIKVNYSELEKAVKEKAGRYYTTLEQISKDLEKRKAEQIEAQSSKEFYLNNGTEAQYLKSCEDLDRLNHSIEYLEQKQRKLVEACGINRESLIQIRQNKIKAQDEALKRYLLQLEAVYKDLNEITEQFKKELETGNDMFNELLQVWRQAPNNQNAVLGYVDQENPLFMSVKKALRDINNTITCEYYNQFIK